MKQNDRKKAAEQFYVEAVAELQKNQLPFMIGGAYALFQHTGIYRDTKDLDLFCKTGDYPRLLKALAEMGYKTEITDARWVAKAFKGEHFIDVIFSTPSGNCVVDDTWFDYAPKVKFNGLTVQTLAPEELMWCKVYVQNRERFDGADVYHVILKQGGKLDWKRLLMRMEAHWEILLSHLTNFRFIYPSDRNIIPEWLMKELLSRVEHQLIMPTPHDKVCRGSILSRTQYETDLKDWGYRDST